LRMAAYTEAKHVCYVTLNPDHVLVREHIRAGGRAIALENGINGSMITIYDHGAHIPLLWTHLIPATIEGKALHNVQNAMFAAAMAFAMGVRLEDIRHGLRTFDTSFFQAPGRLNVYDQHPFRVLFDYGHNADAVEQLCQLANRLDVKGGRICVLSAPGDRRDQDIVAIADVAAKAAFDHYICRRDDSRRGRGDDEVPRMLQAALKARGISDHRVAVIVDEQQAIAAALRKAEPGDLVLIFADALARGWKQITHFKPDAEPQSLASPKRQAPQTIMPEAKELADDSVPPPLSPVVSREFPVLFAPPAPERDASSVDEAAGIDATKVVRDDRGVFLAREAND